KQADQEALAMQAVIAQVAREREELQAQVQQAEIHKHVVDLEAEADELRLAKLQERLQRYPQAAEWEWAGEQLEVARGLAGNTHAIVQVGNGGATDIARAFLVRGIAQNLSVETGADTAVDGTQTEHREENR